MKNEIPNHVILNPDAWHFDDPVVFWVSVTVVFCLSMLTVLFLWVRKNMAADRKSKGGNA